MQNNRGNSLISSLLAFSIFMTTVVMLMSVYNQTLKKSALLITEYNEVIIDEKNLPEFQ